MATPAGDDNEKLKLARTLPVVFEKCKEHYLSNPAITGADYFEYVKRYALHCHFLQPSRNVNIVFLPSAFPVQGIYQSDVLGNGNSVIANSFCGNLVTILFTHFPICAPDAGHAWNMGMPTRMTSTVRI